MVHRVRKTVSRGYGISYEDAGSGFPIALINGFTGRAAEWRDLGIVDRLASSHRVLSVDSLGHGLSDGPHDWEAYMAPAISDDIVAALDDAGIERTAIWGYSRGAWMAAMIAARHPERVAALIAGGSDLVGLPDPGVPATTEALCRGDWDAFWDAFGEVSDRDRAEILLCDPRAIGAADLGSRRSSYVVDLAQITAPSLLYCGGGDEPEELQETAKALGVPVAVVGNAGHFETFAEVDAIVPLVLALLERAVW
jgi:pimeloyl-ACP methyl ester carboxylesterase